MRKASSNKPSRGNIGVKRLGGLHIDSLSDPPSCMTCNRAGNNTARKNIFKYRGGEPLKKAKKNQDKPTFAPAYTKDELEAKAAPEEIAKGDYTRVTILENDRPSGE
jgi:hypothetical protein